MSLNEYESDEDDIDVPQHVLTTEDTDNTYEFTVQNSINTDDQETDFHVQDNETEVEIDMSSLLLCEYMPSNNLIIDFKLFS